MKKKKNKVRNPVAKALMFIKNQVVKDKKKESKKSGKYYEEGKDN